VVAVLITAKAAVVYVVAGAATAGLDDRFMLVQGTQPIWIIGWHRSLYFSADCAGVG
jgi:hypothetical protein